MIESFLWAAKETLRRRGLHFESSDKIPTKPEFWMFLYRGAVVFCSMIAAWILLWLLSSAPFVGAFLATAAVLAIWYFTGISEKGAEHELSQHWLRPSDDAHYDGNRTFALYLALLILRPLCIYFLCLRFNVAWLLAAMLLAAVSVQSFLAGKDSGKKFLPQWILALLVTVLVCGIWAQCMSRPGWLVLVLLASLIAYILPQIAESRIDSLQLQQQHLRKIAYYVFETILLLIGLLEIAA
ncbi:MAG: hypothetical protein J6X55_01900 [Victivallales bacterium]|nr:hypothetical protein [Victivallales bacterium]